MNESSTANRSFLHGKSAQLSNSNINDNTTSKCNEKIVYATLDCLALKRARLPLQLVPVDGDDSNASVKTDKTEVDKKTTNSRKASSRRPSFKVRSGSSLHWKQRHRVNLVTGKFENNQNHQKEGSSRQSLQVKNGNLSKVPYGKNGTKTVPELLDMLIDTGELNSGPPSSEQLIIKSNPKQEKFNGHRFKKNKTDSRKQPNRISAYVKDENVDSKLLKNQSTLHSKLNEAKEHNLDTGYSNIKSNESDPLNDSNQKPVNEPAENRKKTQVGYSTILTNEPQRRSELKFSKLKSLSREELRKVKISEPTNFVHLATATNAKLISKDDNFSVPTTNHKKYSTLPTLNEGLKNFELVIRDLNHWNPNNVHKPKRPEIKVNTNKYVPMSPVDLRSKLHSSNVKSKAKFFDRITAGNNTITKKEPVKIFCEYEEVNKREKSPLLKNDDNPDYPAVVKISENEAEEEKIYELMSDIPTRPKPNSSFLWSSQQIKISKSLASLNYSETNGESKIHDSDEDEYEKYEAYDEYDHVGPSREFIEGDNYDDVGPNSIDEIKKIEEPIEEDVYDDVLPPSYSSIEENISLGSTAVDGEYLPFVKPAAEQKINDSVSTMMGRKQIVQELEPEILNLDSGENHYLSINHDYSSLEEVSSDRDVYDDVGFPSQERVNSLYAGSVSRFSTTTREESEWEDLEETTFSPPLPLPQRNGISGKGGGDVQSLTNKKKLGLTWSHKVRRQRCKASRENSARSSVQNTSDRTSCESGSDNSNYETLYSSQLDDFSSDSETEKENTRGDAVFYGKDEIYSEAPSRPTPPPPREASLSQTLGRRIKLLRRTWSLTKGSLGRIRKKSPGENEAIYGEVIPKEPAVGNHIGTNPVDNKKYFSFKKHFRKSIMGLSTFYLDNNENNSNPTYSDNKEKIYSNGNWSSSESKSWRDDDSVRSQNSNADRCSLLAEEPLYQFYTAAAARIAFESDSDGYEEVEDLIPTQAATDLAKPGHRTLWCQTPQVVNNGLHQKLTAEERKLQEAKFEILTSEASYLSSLRVLEEEFVKNSELNLGILTASEKEKLFGGVPGIRKASERLLVNLENIWLEDPMMYGLPDVLLKHAKRSCNVYVQYCSNQVSIDTTLKELRGRKGSKFLDILSHIEAHPACQSLSLHSFLMLPMQRVTRLPLLADAVLNKLSSDHPERTSWENVLSSLSRVVAECNEGARAAGRQVEMEALARKLEYSSKLTPITLRDRYLIRSGPVTQLSPKTDVDYKLTFGKKLTKTSLHLFLLTDYILITKPKLSPPDETYTVIDTCKRNLITVESVTEDSPWAGRHAMILTLLENHSGREVEFILTCESDTELMRWLDVVSPPKSSLIGETLYESWDCPQVMALYSYAPVQPDELALHPGDVINVFRKMADGWNHGEKLLDGEQGWFPANYTKEVASEHVRARNLKQRHRLLAVTGNLLQKRGKSNAVH